MLKLLQWNINGPGTKHGPWERRRELIAGTIRDVSPDLVTMQAVRKPPEGIDQAVELAGMLHEYDHAVFEPAMRHADGAIDGLAFLSRLGPARVVARPLHRLPGTENPFDRVFLHGRFHLASGPLHVFNAHFSWVEEQARGNVNEALPYVSSFGSPAVLLGDLNRPPEAESMQLFSRHGWTDAWAAVRPDEPGHTFEGRAPNIRIDYAWVNRVLADRVIAIEIVGNGVDGEIRPSDHLGLLVTLDVEC